MAKTELFYKISDVLPGMAPACKGCANQTDAFGCKIQVQSGFYKSSEGDQKEFFARGLAEKAGKMPPGCPIEILLESSVK